MSDPINQLQCILRTMDCPALRMNNINQWNLMWMQRNLPLTNSDHPDLDTALKLIRELKLTIVADETF